MARRARSGCPSNPLRDAIVNPGVSRVLLRIIFHIPHDDLCNALVLSDIVRPLLSMVLG